MRRVVFRWTGWSLVIGGFAMAPRLLGDFELTIVLGMAIFALFSISLNLLLSYTGLLSFGHAMFFAAGAYGTALSLEYLQGFPFVPAVLAGAVSAALLASALSPLLVRASGHTFAMLTMAFSQILYAIVMKYSAVTGGNDGLSGFPIPALGIPGIGGIDMASERNFYYVAMTILGISAWIMWFFTRTPFGSIMVGLRDNPERVAYLGFNVPRSKAVVLIVSAWFAGVAGSMYALFQNMVSIDGVLGPMSSFSPLINCFIGGLGTFIGPVFGTGIGTVLIELMAAHPEQAQLVFSLVLIILVLFLPGGMMMLYWKSAAAWMTLENRIQSGFRRGNHG
ncbi:MAG: branched-chain amino acid ABC transporter permease [Thermodesulfobacteriota bacterium]